MAVNAPIAPELCASYNGKPTATSPFSYPQSVDMGQMLPLEDPANPIALGLLLYVAGFATVMLVFCALYNSVALLQHPLYFYFAQSTTPVALLIIIVLVLFWYVVPRLFKVTYPAWESGCCRACPVVPGCCLPGCPSCPTVPGCPSIVDSGFSPRCPVLCPSGLCGPCISCCPGVDMCCNSPIKAMKVFLKHLKTNMDFWLVLATTLVLLYVWTTILAYFNMGFMDVLPGLHKLFDFFSSPFKMLHFSLPDTIVIPNLTFRIPTPTDVVAMLSFGFSAVFSFLGAPPLVLLATVFGVLFLIMLMLAIFNTYVNLATADGVASPNIWGNAFSIWGTFLLAVGTIFIIAGLPIMREARLAHTELFEDCKTGTKTRNLFVASQALQALRQSPTCAKEESVEHCTGFETTPYTGLLKYMETTFHCSGFCYDSTGVPRGAGALASRDGKDQGGAEPTALVQLDSMLSAGVRRERTVSELEEVARERQGDVFDIPPPLFSQELYVVSCDGMAARDMTHYVDRIGSEIYGQGLLLVFLSVGVLLLRLTGTPWNFKAKNPPELGHTGFQNYGAVRY